MSIDRHRIPRGKRANHEQKGALLVFLEENLDFAQDRSELDDGTTTGNVSSATMQKKWTEISVTLNNMGGAKKNAEQWKQYWRDLKRNTKAKLNGGKANRLDEYEKRVVSIISPPIIENDGVRQQIDFVDICSEVINAEQIKTEYIEVADPTIVEPVDVKPVLTNLETNKIPQQRKRILKRPRIVRPMGDSAAKLLALEERKFDFEIEKFKFYQKIQLQRLELEKRSTAALELIAKSLPK